MDKCRRLTPDTIELLEQEERGELLCAVQAARIDFPSDLKAALTRLAIASEVKRLLASQQLVERDIDVVVSLTLLQNTPEYDHMLNYKCPTLRSIDGSSAEKAELFKKAVIQERGIALI